MMSSENIPPPTTAQETNPQRKPSSANNQRPPQEPQQQPPLKCPRCDSSNTKFCYYNNYSLSQPRHFCKTCRRYWTRGGALRNVPIGGGCRKSKKLKPNTIPSTPSAAITSAVEFHLGGLSLPKLHPATAGVYTQFVNSSSPGPGFGLELLPGLAFPPPPVVPSSSVSLSSIESLSTINQEMHWKLQQQRLASLIYGVSGGASAEEDCRTEKEHQGGGLGVNWFQSLELCNNNNNNHNDNEDHNGNGHINSNNNCNSVAKPTTEWYFDQGNYENNNTSRVTTANTTTTTSPNSYHNNNRMEVEATGGGGGWGVELHQFNGLH